MVFRWARKRFTVLEDFILRVIEDKGGCSDQEIADVLCLDKEDIAVVLDDIAEMKCVQGDDSHRTLADGFTREQPDGIAVVAWQWGKNKKSPPPKEGAEFDADADIIALLGKAPRARDADLSDKQSQWREDKQAKMYRLTVTVTGDKDKPDYHWRKTKIPPSMLKVLGGFFSRKGKKKPAKKAAP